MARSEAKTVAAYLKELPAERRAVVSAVRDLVVEHLPAGYRESMGSGMICYTIPLDVYPDTYNQQPACYVSLAAQKNYYALYLVGVYGDPKKEKQLADAYKKLGKKMDMGKSCLRFKSLDDLPMETLGAIIASVPPETLIAKMEAVKRK